MKLTHKEFIEGLKDYKLYDDGDNNATKAGKFLIALATLTGLRRIVTMSQLPSVNDVILSIGLEMDSFNADEAESIKTSIEDGIRATPEVIKDFERYFRMINKHNLTAAEVMPSYSELCEGLVIGGWNSQINEVNGYFVKYMLEALKGSEDENNTASGKD